MKKILIGVLMALATMVGVTSNAYDEPYCQGNYCCAQQNCDEPSGEYCGRYGCRKGGGN